MSTATAKRRVSPKAVLVLAAAAALFGVTVHFVHGYQVKRNARGLLEEARQVEQEGRLDQAADHLSQYLGMVPGDADALARYGDLLYRLAKDGRGKVRAFLVLDHALHLDGQRPDVRRQAARVAVEIERFKDAKELLSPLLKEAEGDAELTRLLARCEAGAHQDDKAAELYARAVVLAPGDVALCEEYAGLLRERLHQPEAADGVIEGLVARDGRSATARLAAARYFARRGQAEKAETHVQFVLKELDPEGPEALVLAAAVAGAQRKAGEARGHLERGLQAHPQDARLGQALARLELQEGRPEQAVRHLQTQVRALPSDPDELWQLGDLLTDAGDAAGAREVIQRLREAKATAAADYLEARGLMKKGAWGEARNTLERARVGSARLPELSRRVDLLLADCFAQLGNPDERLRACRRALQADPLWVPGRRALAAALAAVGQVDQTVAEYGKLVGQAPELRGPLAALLLARNLRLPPAERRWGAVEQLLEEMADGRGPVGETAMLRARVWAAQGRFDEARALLEKERQRDPKQTGPWLALAALQQQQGKREAVLPLLEEAERRLGPQAEWELARVRHWALGGEADARRELPKIEERLARLPEAGQDALHAGLGSAYVLVGDLPAAERHWRRLAERQPDNLAVRFLLVERCLETENEAEARRLLGEVQRIEGGAGAYSAFCQAGVHFLRARRGDEGAAAEAHRELQAARSLRPTWSRVPLLDAQVWEVEKRKDKALEKYQAALDLGEGRLAVVRRALNLLYEQGRYAEGCALLHKVTPSVVASADLNRLATGLTLLGEGAGTGREGEEARERALRLAAAAVPGDSGDYRDHLWLGQVAQLAGQPKEAEKAFRRARDLAKTAPETWVALILLLAERDARQAEAELAEAIRQLPRAAAPLALAPCCEALGRPEQAEEQYRAALGAKPDEPAVLRDVAGFYVRANKRGQAEPLLRRLLAAETKAPEATAAWARRALAVSLAGAGTYPEFQEARALLGETGKGGVEGPEDRRARGLVLATQPAHRREAIRLLESLPPRPGREGADVQLRLAQLDEAEGNWPRGRQRLLALLATDGKSPVALAQYVRALLRRGEAAEAEPWAERLAEVSPGAPEAVELRARVLHATGRTAQASGLLQTYARQKGARVDLAAQWLDECGDAAAAEKVLREYAATSKNPESGLLLAKHLGRHGRAAEALDLCERAWAACPPEAVARASVVVLRAGKPTAEQRRRVEERLTAASRKYPQSPVLATLLAETQELQGRYAEAMRWYRRVLELDGQQVVARNNLAYLLALQDGKGDEALELIQGAIRRVGPYAELLDTRAVVYLKSQRADLALKDVEQAVAQAPSPAMYFHLAQARRLAKDARGAQKAYRSAVNLGLKASDVHPLERPALERLASELTD